MTDAPERMWVFPKKDWFMAGASTHKILGAGAKDVEYILADRYEELVEENKRLWKALETVYNIEDSGWEIPTHISEIIYNALAGKESE